MENNDELCWLNAKPYAIGERRKGPDNEIYIVRKLMVNRPKWIKTAEQLYSVQSQLKELRDKQEQLAEELKRLSEYKTAKAGNYVYLASERKGAIDYSAIDILRGLNLEPYRKDPVTTWKLEQI